MVGVPKSLVTTEAAAVPASVTNQTIYITGIHNAHSATATIEQHGAPLEIKTPSAKSIGNGITLNVFSITSPLASGAVIAFTGGGIFTLTSAAAANAYSYSGNLTVAALTANELGYTDGPAGRGPVVAKVKAGVSFTPPSPIKLGAERKIYSDVTDVTITYVVEGGPTITGPAGLTGTATSY